MKVALLCLFLLPFADLVGQSTLNLTFHPDTGYYKGRYTYAQKAFQLDVESNINLKRMQMQAKVNKLSSPYFSYTDSRYIGLYTFLPAQSWRSLSFQQPAYSVSLLRGGGEQTAIEVQAGSFSALYQLGPNDVHAEDLALAWDNHLLGRNLIVRYRFDSDQAFLSVEGVWGEFRSLAISTKAGIRVGPVSFQSSSNSPFFVRNLEAGIHVQKKGFSLHHSYSSTLGLPPIHGGHSQTMQTVLETRFAYKGLSVEYQQEFLVDALSARSREMELQVLYAGSKLQTGVVFSSDSPPKLLMEDKMARLSFQSSKISAVFVFQRSNGSVSLRFHPQKGLTISYSFHITTDQHNESPPRA